MFSPALVQLPSVMPSNLEGTIKKIKKLAGYVDKFHWPHKVILTEFNCILCVAIRSVDWTLIVITCIISTLVKRKKGEGFCVTVRRLVGFPKARKF